MAKAFASFLIGDSYRDHLLCLQTRLEAVRSSFPLLVLHDDRQPAHMLSQLSNPISLSALVGMQPRAYRTRTTGRRLLQEGQASNASHFKLFAWRLLNYSRIALLDADLYVVRNIDALLSLDVRQGRLSIAAVPVNHPKCRNTGYFNSGVLVLKPSRLSSARLMSLDLCLAGVQPDAFCKGVAAHDQKRRFACEGRQFSDQSLLNMAFKDDWLHLNDTYNQPVHASTMGLHQTDFMQPGGSRAAVLHVVGEPKPRSMCAVARFYANLARKAASPWAPTSVIRTQKRNEKREREGSALLSEQLERASSNALESRDSVSS